MTVKVYNTLTKNKEAFVPYRGNEVHMYVCGPTVYDYFHVGNARAFMTFDVIRRYLEYRGYQVTYVQNITDIEDKMIKRANELGISMFQLAEEYTEKYFEDARALGIKDADVHPRATEHIEEIIALIEGLMEKGYAYQVNGDVYFDTQAFSDYGKLGKQDLEELNSGARIDVDERKRHPVDFVLWKEKKAGEPYWESPFGKGRPGWHIECSAMSMKYLKVPLDIHAGGSDLVFPHHENEIAQSEAATGEPFCRYWMHVGYLEIDNRKMSKSLGNFWTVRDFRKAYDPRVLRLFMLNAHYRNPINFTVELIEQAKNSLERLDNFYDNLAYYESKWSKQEITDRDEEILETIKKVQQDYIAAMDDDFNTAGAIAALFTLVREVNSYINAGSGNKQVLEAARQLVSEMDGVLGLLPTAEQEVEILDEEITRLIEEREQARASKNYQRADEIRDYLQKQGILIEDTPEGVKWKRK